MNKLSLIFSSVALALALFATLIVAVYAGQQEQTITVLARLSNAITNLQEQTQVLKENSKKLNPDEPTLSEKEVIANVRTKLASDWKEEEKKAIARYGAEWRPTGFTNFSRFKASYEGKGAWTVTYTEQYIYAEKPKDMLGEMSGSSGMDALKASMGIIPSGDKEKPKDMLEEVLRRPFDIVTCYYEKTGAIAASSDGACR